MRLKLSILTTILLLGCSVRTCAQTESRIDKLNAIQIAEDFIVHNGYTDLPPTNDKSKVSYESCCSDGEGPVEKILMRRHNTLERQAYGARLMSPFKKQLSDRLFWYVIFRYKPPCPNCNPGAGRVVRISVDGRNAEMVHQDFRLKDFKRERGR